MVRSRGADEPIAEILALILRPVEADVVLATNIGWPRRAAKKRREDIPSRPYASLFHVVVFPPVSVHFQPRDCGHASVYAPSRRSCLGDRWLLLLLCLPLALGRGFTYGMAVHSIANTG